MMQEHFSWEKIAQNITVAGIVGAVAILIDLRGAMEGFKTSVANNADTIVVLSERLDECAKTNREQTGQINALQIEVSKAWQ